MPLKFSEMKANLYMFSKSCDPKIQNSKFVILDTITLHASVENLLRFALSVLNFKEMLKKCS